MLKFTLLGRRALMMTFSCLPAASVNVNTGPFSGFLPSQFWVVSAWFVTIWKVETACNISGLWLHRYGTASTCSFLICEKTQDRLTHAWLMNLCKENLRAEISSLSPSSYMYAHLPTHLPLASHPLPIVFPNIGAVLSWHDRHNTGRLVIKDKRTYSYEQLSY